MQTGPRKVKLKQVQEQKGASGLIAEGSLFARVHRKITSQHPVIPVVTFTVGRTGVTFQLDAAHMPIPASGTI